LGGYSYQVFVTNLALRPLPLWRFYNQRARAELIIRELKDAYALGKIPTKDFLANEVFFQIVLLAYNLLNWFKRLCAPAHLQRATLQRSRAHLAHRAQLRFRFGLFRNPAAHTPNATALSSLQDWPPVPRTKNLAEAQIASFFTQDSG